MVGGYVIDESDVTFDDAAPTMAFLIVLGALVGLAGIGGMVVHGILPDSEPRAAAPPPAPLPATETEGARRKREAWDLFQQARVSAYGNDCLRVTSLGSQVMLLDRWTYDGYFVRDPYIARCSEPAPAPSPPP
jgi:hypothetical protein